MHEFSTAVERLASPVLDEWYRENFSKLLAIVDVTSHAEFQHAGIDKYLIFKHPELPKIIHVSIDEKVRTQSWSDILAEVWSKKEKEIPGWAWTCKADYIVYAFFNPATRKLMEPPRFIQPLELIKLLKTKEYPTKLALNVGWTTVNKAIPKSELSSRPPKGWLIHDFV
ncbi:MAG: hypothetical protein QXL91_06320 [Candidatus Bathyarchaeia archaeon]